MTEIPGLGPDPEGAKFKSGMELTSSYPLLER